MKPMHTTKPIRVDACLKGAGACFKDVVYSFPEWLLELPLRINHLELLKTLDVEGPASRPKRAYTVR